MIIFLILTARCYCCHGDCIKGSLEAIECEVCCCTTDSVVPARSRTHRQVSEGERGRGINMGMVWAIWIQQCQDMTIITDAVSTNVSTVRNIKPSACIMLLMFDF